MKKIQIELKWALIFTVAALLWMVVEKLLGWHSTHIDKHALYTNFFAIVATAIYVFALLDKRNNFYEGYMSWQQGFVSGLIMSLIVMVLTPLTQWITSTIITPEYFGNAIAYAVESGNATQEEAEGMFNLRSYIIQATIFVPIVGAITAAIVAIFVRKSK